MRGRKGTEDGTANTVKRRGGTHKKSVIESQKLVNSDGDPRARILNNESLMLNDLIINEQDDVMTSEYEEGEEIESESEFSLMEQIPMIPTYSHFGMYERSKPAFTQMFGTIYF